MRGERGEVESPAGVVAVGVVGQPAIRRVVNDAVAGVVGRMARVEHPAMQHPGGVDRGEDGVAEVDLVDAVLEVGDTVDIGGRAEAGIEDEVVLARPAGQRVVAEIAEEVVAGLAAHDAVVAGLAIDCAGGAAETDEAVVAAAEVHGAVNMSATDDNVAGPGADDVAEEGAAV